MLPKMLPSTCRALGSMAATLLRSAGMPLEPPVKNTVSTWATPTPASFSSAVTLPRTRSSRVSMDASNSARLMSTLRPGSMRSSGTRRLSAWVSWILVSSTSMASQWPARWSISLNRRSMPAVSSMS